MGAPAQGTRRRWARRFGWLALYWLAGVATVGAAATILRALMRLVGLAS